MEYYESNYPKIRGSRFDIFTINVRQFCDQVVNHKNMNNKDKIDNLLELDATLYMHLGSGSTKSEIAQTKKQSRHIYRAIKSIDDALGTSFLSHQDKT